MKKLLVLLSLAAMWIIYIAAAAVCWELNIPIASVGFVILAMVIAMGTNTFVIEASEE